jgi:hypothetical protein
LSRDCQISVIFLKLLTVRRLVRQPLAAVNNVGEDFAEWIANLETILVRFQATSPMSSRRA